jgi:hypothetical protein
MNILTLMNDLFFAGIWLLPLLLFLAAIMHIRNLSRVRKLMAVLQGKTEVSKALLYKEMTVSQGSNFTALALASWIMLFVAIAYLYLLVPTVFPFSYMDLPELSSNTLGFAIFGLIVAALAAITILFLDKLPEDYRDLKLTELYSFYSLSKGMKRMIGMTVLALCISVFLSAYIGTIYPIPSKPVQLLSIMLLIASAVILVMPVYKVTWGARR